MSAVPDNPFRIVPGASPGLLDLEYHLETPTATGVKHIPMRLSSGVAPHAQVMLLVERNLALEEALAERQKLVESLEGKLAALKKKKSHEE